MQLFGCGTSDNEETDKGIITEKDEEWTPPVMKVQEENKRKHNNKRNKFKDSQRHKKLKSSVIVPIEFDRMMFSRMQDISKETEYEGRDGVKTRGMSVFKLIRKLCYDYINTHTKENTSQLPTPKREWA